MVRRKTVKETAVKPVSNSSNWDSNELYFRIISDAISFDDLDSLNFNWDMFFSQSFTQEYAIEQAAKAITISLKWWSHSSVKSALDKLFSIGLLGHLSEPFVKSELEIHNPELLHLWSSVKTKIEENPKILENTLPIIKFFSNVSECSDPEIFAHYKDILISLLSCPLTRKYLTLAIRDLHILSRIKVNQMMVVDLIELTYNLPFDSLACLDLTFEEFNAMHMNRLAKFQISVFEICPTHLHSSFAFTSPDKLLAGLNLNEFLDEDIRHLYAAVGFRTEMDRQVMVESLILHLTCPTECTLVPWTTGLSLSAKHMFLQNNSLIKSLHERRMKEMFSSLSLKISDSISTKLNSCNVLERTEIDLMKMKTKQVIVEITLNDFENLSEGDIMFLANVRDDDSVTIAKGRILSTSHLQVGSRSFQTTSGTKVIRTNQASSSILKACVSVESLPEGV